MAILSPVRLANGSEILSMANTGFVFAQEGQQLPLDKISWKSFDVETAADSSQAARFEAVIKEQKSGEPVIKLIKTYRLAPGGYDLDCSIAVENLSAAEQKVRFNLTGPVGIKREDARAVSALVQPSSVDTGRKKTLKVPELEKPMNQVPNPAAATM